MFSIFFPGVGTSFLSSGAFFTFFNDERFFLAPTGLNVGFAARVGVGVVVVADSDDGRHADFVHLVGRLLLVDVASTSFSESGLPVGAFNLGKIIKIIFNYFIPDYSFYVAETGFLTDKAGPWAPSGETGFLQTAGAK